MIRYEKTKNEVRRVTKAKKNYGKIMAKKPQNAKKAQLFNAKPFL
jgi:hypothetical protein